MDRKKLINEVKDEYARLAASNEQHHFRQTTQDITPQAYYENVLNMVLDEISKGTFDNFQSGNSVVEAVANDKHKWIPEWDKK